MKKIVNIANDIVYIGNEDGSIQEVRLSDCSFKPEVGDSVNVFSSDSKTIVAKVDAPKPAEPNNDRFHINIVNENKNQSTGSPMAFVQSGTVVNKMVYCILAFFLGGIGVHKFYAGKIGMGIVYLLFCWTMIPSIVAFIEFILALMKTSDANGNIIV